METVGVGQSEIAVSDLVDCVVLVLPPSGGGAREPSCAAILFSDATMIVCESEDAEPPPHLLPFRFQCKPADELQAMKRGTLPMIAACHPLPAESVSPTASPEPLDRGPIQIYQLPLIDRSEARGATRSLLSTMICLPYLLHWGDLSNPWH